MKPQYIETIPHTVAGIPCLIGVVSYYRKYPDINADNDMDFHGFVECEWELLDRKGYRAKWLEAKVTEAESDLIDEAINQHQQELES